MSYSIIQGVMTIRSPLCLVGTKLNWAPQALSTKLERLMSEVEVEFNFFRPATDIGFLYPVVLA